MSVCYPAMQLAAVNAMYDKQYAGREYHDGTWTIFQEKRSRLTPFHVRDGVSLWLSPDDITPDDDFLNQRRSASQQIPGKSDQPDERE